MNKRNQNAKAAALDLVADLPVIDENDPRVYIVFFAADDTKNDEIIDGGPVASKNPADTIEGIFDAFDTYDVTIEFVSAAVPDTDDGHENALDQYLRHIDELLGWR